jgi:2-polyprenyl-3-methyl-5-hydroxy-6-metoxy-1,4-benzoquinol methylase
MLLGFDEEKLTKWSSNYFKYHLLPRLPADRSSVILDVGCGYGRHICALMECGYGNAFGIDVSKEQVEYGKSKLGLTNIEVVDSLQFLEEKTNSYDVILLLDVLEHLEVEYAINLLARIGGALRDGGILIVQVPNALSPLCVNLYGDVTHKRAYTVHSVEQIVRMAGYATDTISHFPLGPFPMDWKSPIQNYCLAVYFEPAYSHLSKNCRGRIVRWNLY